MVLNAAVQMLREADELKHKMLKFKSGTSMLQERGVWATQQELQKVYQKVLVLDLDYALDKKVEQDLWNIGFKQQIEALQAISKDRKNPLRSEAQAMLSWVLQAAAGFYLCLLHQICTTFKLDLPFRRRASLLGWVEGWGVGAGGEGAGAGAGGAAPAAARYICQHCLVHLGDLARYRHHLRVAYTFYRQAVVVWTGSGQPYNQLALVSWRRGRRLAALYWHVRSVLVLAPFPPAADNLARTLRAAATAASTSTLKDLPVIPGVTSSTAESVATPKASAGPLDGHAYVSELIRAMHLIYTAEDLDTASSIVESLNASLTALVAIDSFEPMTLIKMAVVLMWLVHSTTEDLTAERSSMTEAEWRAGALSESLAAAAVLALLLPNYTAQAPLQTTLPALKVWLQWVVCQAGASARAGWAARPQLWPALAHTLNSLAQTPPLTNSYETVPLPEDEELHGFLPLEGAFKGLKFASHAAWDTYGGAIPQADNVEDTESPCEVSATSLNKEPELESKVRAHRLVALGKKLAQLRPEHLTYQEEEGTVKFSSVGMGSEQLLAAVAELSAARAGQAGGAGGGAGGRDDEADTDDDRPAPPPPIVISEADFREKVREKRVGILKPQGSLERAREERAMATQDDPEENGDESLKGEDKKEARKPRVNIAMAAIMRKQEETNKQVKFVTPPPTPDSTADSTETKDQDKPKVIQPKVMKSLANLPIGRKTGGILSLKDKSAGYPHLVNTDPEPAKKDDRKDLKINLGSSQQGYQTKRQDTSQNWGSNLQSPNAYNEPRMGFPKNYQTPGISFNPAIPPPNANQGIRLPVVNPKEIDVRTAALQKQNSRQELFHDGQKFSNHNYQITTDKKNFLNDLPPRFANQYRYWQSAQENQFNDNKFRDENFKPNNSLFNSQQQRPSWMPDTYQQPAWWKPENPTNYNANYPVQPLQMPNFYATPLASNMPNPYQNLPSFQMQNQSIGQTKQDNLLNPPSYLQSSLQPQVPSLQNLVTSPNYTSPLNNFGTYAPAVSYDSSMYPQFNKLGYQPLQMKMMDKPQLYQGGKDLMDLSSLNFASMDLQQRNVNMGFSDPLNSSDGANSVEQTGSMEGGEASGATNTYSLFSGAQESTAWGSGQRHPQQSLWSGPGPSPLERLLEQQKQLKQPPAPQ